jgi:hypothetical protein
MDIAQDHMKINIIFHWLSEQLKEGSLTSDELQKRFQEHFIAQTPKILALIPIGYNPKSDKDLQQVLDTFVVKGKLDFSEGKYSLRGNINSKHITWRDHPPK